MVFYTRIKGKVIDEKISSKGKRYIKVYNGSDLINVFVDSDGYYNVGDEVEIDCVVYTKDAYISGYVS